MGESSSRTNRQVRAYIESFLNETMASIKEMGNKDDPQPCYEFDGCVLIPQDEIESLLLLVLQDGNGSISEENWPKLKTDISKRKVLKAWLKVKLQGKGKGLITKFFRPLRNIRKNYKKMVKKLKDYARDIDWKRATRLLFLIAVIAVVTSAVITFLISPSTAPMGVALASVVLSFFTVLQDWYEIRFKEVEKKNHGKEKSISTASIKLDENNGYFARWAEAEFQNIKMTESFTGTLEELRPVVAKSSKRMLADGRKVIENMMKEVENKAN